jgi:hypothetical protein
MPLRFQKRLRLGKGLWINLGKSGASLSAGRRGATVNLGRRGVQGTLGIPGSGLSWRERLWAPGRSAAGVLRTLALIAGVLALAWLVLR